MKYSTYQIRGLASIILSTCFVHVFARYMLYRYSYCSVVIHMHPLHRAPPPTPPPPPAHYPAHSRQSPPTPTIKSLVVYTQGPPPQ